LQLALVLQRLLSRLHHAADSDLAFFAMAAGAQGASAPVRLLSSYSTRHVPVDGGGDVMDEPGVPVRVGLQVRGQRMTVWALLRGEGLVLGLFHGVHLLEGKGLSLYRGTNQTRSSSVRRPTTWLRRCVLDLVDAQHSRDHLSSLPSSTIFFQSSPRRKVDRERHHELDYSRDADVALRVNAAARADLVGEGDGVRRIGLVSPGASLLPDIQNLRALSAVVA
jgi:hypothetical protein